MENMTIETIRDILQESQMAARESAQKFFDDKLGGVDRGMCGFAWVEICGIKGNSKLGRKLKAAGISQNYRRLFELWNPAKFPVQNIDTLEAGAIACAEVWRKYGFDAYAGSRYD